ncbi:hypothetical protein HDU93_006217, partial [Gonapodya sp. JEL0774]
MLSRKSRIQKSTTAAVFSFLLCFHVVAQNITFAPVPSPTAGSPSSLANNPIPVPDGNKVYLGATLDWDWDQPNNISRRLGSPFLTYSIFVKFPLGNDDIAFVNATVKTKPFPVVGADGTTPPQLMLTFQPVEVVALDDSTLNNKTVLDDVVSMIRDLNEKGVSVFLRPMQYKKAFRRVAEAIKACSTCKSTAMLWAPQV